MQEFWHWLGGDASPWDAIATVGVFFVVAALAVAALRRARAVIALVREAKSHDEAANLAPERHAPFSEKETFPNILIGAATSREGEIMEDTIAILNMGGGVAMDLHLHCRDESSSHEIPLDKRELVARDILPVPFAASRSTASRFQLTFSTDFGTHYSLEFEWDSHDSRAINEKITVIPPGAHSS